MAGVSSKTLYDEIKNILTEGQKEASSLGKGAINDYESLINQVKTSRTNGVDIGLTTLELLNKTLLFLFDPGRGYVFLKDQIVALLGHFGDTLEEEDIPPNAKPHVVLLQCYLTEANKTLEKIENGITELLKFIESCFGRDLRKAELQGTTFKINMINCDLDVCKMYVSKAQTELLEAEKAIGFNILLSLLGETGLIDAGAFPVNAVTTSVMAGMAYAAGATARGTFAIMKNLASYAKWLNDFKNDKLPKLELLNLKIKEIEKRIEVLKEDE